MSTTHDEHMALIATYALAFAHVCSADDVTVRERIAEKDALLEKLKASAKALASPRADPAHPAAVKEVEPRYAELASEARVRVEDFDDTPVEFGHYSGSKMKEFLLRCADALDMLATPRASTDEAAGVPTESHEQRAAHRRLIELAAECAQRKPLATLAEFEDATHIGHRQFARAYAKADEAMCRLAMDIRNAADSMRAALSSTPATVPAINPNDCLWARNGHTACQASTTVPQDVGVPEGWSEAYSAFLAAFDTPVARRKHDDEYAQDARRRMRDFNESLLAATPNPPTAQAMTLADAAKSFPNGPFGQPHIAQPEAGVQGGQTDEERADYWQGRAIVAERRLAAQPERVALTPEQRRKIIVNAHDVGHAIDMVETAHGIGSTPGTAQP